jgi:K+-transporting ATPase ATPase C chain
MVEWKKILKISKSSVVIAVVSLVLLGFVIPTITAAIAENVDPGSSNGSQINIGGHIYGSYLLAQAFNKTYFFQPRPSAIDYNQSESGSPCCSPNTIQSINQTIKNLNEFENLNPNVTLSQIPGEIVMDSDSGLDPNIPLSAAMLEEPRVVNSIIKFAHSSNVFNLTSKTVNATIMNLINATEKQNFPVFGSYYVNVMYVNVGIIDLMLGHNIIKNSSLD